MKKLNLHQLEQRKFTAEEASKVEGGVIYNNTPSNCPCQRLPEGSDSMSNSANYPTPPGSGGGGGGGGDIGPSCRCSSYSPDSGILSNEMFNQLRK